MFVLTAGNSRGDKSAACDFTSSNTSTWVSQNVHPSRRSAVGDEIADGPIPFKSFSYDLMIKRFGVDPILFQFRSDEPLIGDSKGFSCLSFDVYHFSKQWGQIKLWAGNTFEWKKQLLWSRPRSIFDQWETYSVTLTKEMQVLTFESDLKLIAFSAIRHQIGACDPNSYIDFETDIKSWFKTKQSGALEFVRKQAGNNRVDVLDNSLDDQLDMNNTYIDAYEENNELFDYLPKIDVTTETGHGHYVTVRSSDKNSKTKMSVIETEFNLSENSEAIFLEFYAHNVARGKCHTIQMYVREKDANISTANLKQMVYDSDSTTTDLLMNPWQKYHVLILVGNRFKLSIHAYQQKGADCAPAIDHLRVYTVESIRFRDDNEVNYMLGCDFDYSLCNFQNIPTEKNSWLIAPGRIDSKKYIRIPGASRFVGETKLVSYAYADFSGDSASNIGVLRLAGVRLSTYVSHENCVTVVYWIDYNVSRTIARFTVRIVNENVNLVVFESNEPTNRKWIKALIPVHQNGNYRLVFEAEVADLSVPAFIAIKSVNLNLGRCFDNLTLPLIEAVHDLSCDFIEDTCGWKKTGNSGWDNQVERFSIFPRSNSYVSYLSITFFLILLIHGFHYLFVSQDDQFLLQTRTTQIRKSWLEGSSRRFIDQILMHS